MELYQTKRAVLDVLAASVHVARIAYRPDTPDFVAHCVLLNPTAFWAEVAQRAAARFACAFPERSIRWESINRRLHTVLRKMPIREHQHHIMHQVPLMKTSTCCLVLKEAIWDMSESMADALANETRKADFSVRCELMNYSVHGNTHLAIGRDACVMLPTCHTMETEAPLAISISDAELDRMATHAVSIPTAIALPDLIDSVEYCLRGFTPGQDSLFLTVDELRGIRDALVHLKTHYTNDAALWTVDPK